MNVCWGTVQHCFNFEKNMTMSTESLTLKTLIIGSGPAGYTAAIYAARADLQPVLYTGMEPGGQLTTTTEVENFPGYPEGVDGPAMMVDLQKQAERFGTEVYIGMATAVELSKEVGGTHKVTIDNDKVLQTKTIIIAFFVHKSLYNSFLEKYVERVNNLKLGFGIDQKPDMGPMVTRNDRDRMFDLINDATEKGGVLLAGGEIPQGMEDGNWMMPTVISEMTTEMRLFREETFGPIAPFMSFETDEEVLRLANDTEFGLASYIFTNNSDRINRFSEQLAFGEVQVNGVKYAIYLPHGGIKNSGIGHDCSHLALEDYLVKKRVSVAL